eukprot:5651064-Pyramimonas_sp.AAC.1
MRLPAPSSHCNRRRMVLAEQVAGGRARRWLAPHALRRPDCSAYTSPEILHHVELPHDTVLESTPYPGLKGHPPAF